MSKNKRIYCSTHIPIGNGTDSEHAIEYPSFYTRTLKIRFAIESTCCTCDDKIWNTFALSSCLLLLLFDSASSPSLFCLLFIVWPFVRFSVRFQSKHTHFRRIELIETNDEWNSLIWIHTCQCSFTYEIELQQYQNFSSAPINWNWNCSSWRCIYSNWSNHLDNYIKWLSLALNRNVFNWARKEGTIFRRNQFIWTWNDRINLNEPISSNLN